MVKKQSVKVSLISKDGFYIITPFKIIFLLPFSFLISDIKLNFLILLCFFVLLYLSKRLRPTFSTLQWLLHWSRYKISKLDIFLLRCRVHHDWFTNKEVQGRWLLERKCNLLQRLHMHTVLLHASNAKRKQDS